MGRSWFHIREYWENELKILITGGAGFIGSNFVITQINKGNTVLNFDKLTYAGCKESLSIIEKNPNYKFIKGDIVDNISVENTINQFKPEAIVHFAAESHVDRSIEGPADFIQTNIIGTYTLLEESFKYYKSLSNKDQERFRFLHVSTDEVFGTLNETGYFTESTAYDPSSPYSASKAASDHLVMAWYRTYNFPVLLTNCSNNYGPYQFPEKLIPLMILNALSYKPLPIYGKGENIRDWLYVLDHCDAIDTVLRMGKVGESYIIGGNSEKTNVEVVHTICNLLDEIVPHKNGTYRELIKYVKDRPGHDFRYAIDFSKIKNELGWEPSVDFAAGIRNTIQWYLDNKNWWKNIQDNNYNQERLGLKTV